MEDWLFGFFNIENWFEFWWVALGFLAQAIFASRFIVQWLASEREGRSYIPVAFWYLSISGGLLMLAYAIYRQDPVFILGQSTGVIVYARNLMLIHRANSASENGDAKGAPENSGAKGVSENGDAKHADPDAVHDQT